MTLISINCHSSIKIEGKEITIYVDPFHINDESKDADLILVTHDHFDHYSPDDIKKVSNENTVVLKLKPYETFEMKNAKIEAVPSYNVEKEFHPKENNWVGYLIEVDNKIIYVTGDTDAQLEIDKKIDYLLIPIGGTYTFDVNSAVEYTNKVKPKTVIPTHYGEIVGDKELGEEFKKLVDEKIQVILKIK